MFRLGLYVLGIVAGITLLTSARPVLGLVFICTVFFMRWRH